MRTLAIVVLASLGIVLVACTADKGESCEDEGTVGGDCASGLMCARQKDDETSGLVCLTPCVEQADCQASESCSGERSRNQKVCRPR